jgi:hypothetical protein
MKIITPVVNNINFIYIQYYTLKKYMKCDYEFIVFNDAKDFPDETNNGNIYIRQEIRDICKKLNIKCIDIPNEHHKAGFYPAKRTADSCNYILKYQIENPDKYLVIDSDMFLINDFHIKDYEQYECSIVLQHRAFDIQEDAKIYRIDVNYFWSGLYYFDTVKMKHKELLDWDFIEGLDAGGFTAKWLKTTCDKIPDTKKLRYDKITNYNTQNIYFIKHLWSLTWDENEMPQFADEQLREFLNNDPRNENGKYFCEIYDNKFFHYRAGGNWKKEGINFHNDLSKKLMDVLTSN